MKKTNGSTKIEMKIRSIPESNNTLLGLISGKNRKELTIKEYEKQMCNLEKSIEEKVIKMLDMINTHASVKTDRYSLPYKQQIKHTRNASSYLNDAFDTRQFIREIASEVLKYEITKLRFYVFAEMEGGMFGKMNYYFNYYPH
jgi:coenzyme F420-reducing hydrogenase alpha subunit